MANVETITLAKALSVKNRLAGRLSQARSNVETYNCVQAGQRDGQAVDVSEGRVFLVNASTLLQVQAALPDLAPAADGAAFVTAATARLREALRACPELAGVVR